MSGDNLDFDTFSDNEESRSTSQQSSVDRNVNLNQITSAPKPPPSKTATESIQNKTKQSTAPQATPRSNVPQKAPTDVNAAVALAKLLAEQFGLNVTPQQIAQPMNVQRPVQRPPVSNQNRPQNPPQQQVDTNALINQVMGSPSTSLTSTIKQNSFIAASGNRYSDLDSKFDWSLLTGPQKLVVIKGGKYSVKRTDFKEVMNESIRNASGFQNSAAQIEYMKDGKTMIIALQTALWNHVTNEEMEKLKWANVYRNKDLRLEVAQLWAEGNARTLGSSAWLNWNGTFAACTYTQEILKSIVNRLRVMRKVCENIQCQKLIYVNNKPVFDIYTQNFQKLESGPNFDWVTVDVNRLSPDECLYVIENVNVYKLKQIPAIKQEPEKYVKDIKKCFHYMAQCFHFINPKWKANKYIELLNKWDGVTKDGKVLKDFPKLFFDIKRRVLFALRYVKKQVYGGKRGVINRWSEADSLTDFANLEGGITDAVDFGDLDEPVEDEVPLTQNNSSQIATDQVIESQQYESS